MTANPPKPIYCPNDSRKIGDLLGDSHVILQCKSCKKRYEVQLRKGVIEKFEEVGRGNLTNSQ